MARRFPIPDQPSPHVLVPFDPREAVSVAEAARQAGKHPGHMRRLVDLYSLGRRVGGGNWQVSRIALRMFLDNDARALKAYWDGRRDDPAVSRYFAAAGLKK